MREYIFSGNVFLQIENRRKERHSELAVNKLSEASRFLSPFIGQIKIYIFLLHYDFSSWNLLVISLNFEESSATNKAHSSVPVFFGVPKQRPEICMFICDVSDTKIKNNLWLGKFQRSNLAQKGSWKWNRSRDWLISWKECCSGVSSRFFAGGGGGWHCVTSQKTTGRRLWSAWS